MKGKGEWEERRERDIECKGRGWDGKGKGDGGGGVREVGGRGGEKGFHQFLEDIPLTYFCH